MWCLCSLDVVTWKPWWLPWKQILQICKAPWNKRIWTARCLIGILLCWHMYMYNCMQLSIGVSETHAMSSFSSQQYSRSIPGGIQHNSPAAIHHFPLRMVKCKVSLHCLNYYCSSCIFHHRTVLPYWAAFVVFWNHLIMQFLAVLFSSYFLSSLSYQNNQFLHSIPCS